MKLMLCAVMMLYLQGHENTLQHVYGTKSLRKLERATLRMIADQSKS